MVTLEKNLRNFKIEYLILKGLDLKSSKNDPQTLLKKVIHNCYSKIELQTLFKNCPTNVNRLSNEHRTQKCSKTVTLS